MRRNLIVLSLIASIGPAFAQDGDAAKWNDLIAKAKMEGQVVVSGPPAAGLRAGLSAAFSKRFGIPLNYLGESASETIARIDTESKAGRVSIDANLGGASSCWAISARGQIENMTGKLIDPELVKSSVWRNGKIKLIDPGKLPEGSPADFKCGFQTAEWVMTDLFVNSSIIPPGQITSWKDLLKPEYKGKIASYDPRRSGPGGTPAGYLAALFGQKYNSDLFVGQNVRLTADNRQLAEWVVRGEYPIGIALVQFTVEAFRKQGLPIQRVFPKDGPGALTGGFSVVMLVKNAPHPAAGQLFANWFGSPEAQNIYESEMMEESLRNDTAGKNVPDYIRPQTGAQYTVDDYTYDHMVKYRLPAVEALAKEIQR
jgi:iron(III) transport system substrate-binding protein